MLQWVLGVNLTSLPGKSQDDSILEHSGLGQKSTFGSCFSNLYRCKHVLDLQGFQAGPNWTTPGVIPNLSRTTFSLINLASSCQNISEFRNARPECPIPLGLESCIHN